MSLVTTAPPLLQGLPSVDEAPRLLRDARQTGNPALILLAAAAVAEASSRQADRDQVKPTDQSYAHCAPMTPCPCTAWLLEFQDGAQETRLELWPSHATLDEVHQAALAAFPARQLIIRTVDLGQFTVSHTGSTHYSHDGRGVTDTYRLTL